MIHGCSWPEKRIMASPVKNTKWHNFLLIEWVFFSQKGEGGRHMSHVVLVWNVFLVAVSLFRAPLLSTVMVFIQWVDTLVDDANYGFGAPKILFILFTMFLVKGQSLLVYLVSITVPPWSLFSSFFFFLYIKGIFSYFINIFLHHESQDVNKTKQNNKKTKQKKNKNKKPISNISVDLIPISSFKVMHDYVCFIALPIV